MNAPIRLSELTGMIADSINSSFYGKSFWVQAEITDLRNYPDRQYCFFKLVEQEGGNILASADAVIWRNEYPIIRGFELSTGIAFRGNLQLLLQVQVTYNARFGMRLQVQRLDSTYTIGKMEQEKQEVLNRLLLAHPEHFFQVEGQYFSSNSKHPVPPVIQRIALITAPDSDGQRDFTHELLGNSYGFGFSIRVFPSLVQGEGAARQLSAALEHVGKQADAFDVVVVVRGGGSNTDLSAFDAYETVLATGLCPIPVFTGIGHERNVSLADMMAAQSHKTPTKVAAAILAHNLHYISGVLQDYRNIQRVAARKLERLRLETISKWNGVLQQAQWKLNRQKQWVEHTLRLMRQMDPSRLLEQGYALVYHQGKRIDHVSKLESGNNITLLLQGGRIEANITEIKSDGTE